VPPPHIRLSSELTHAGRPYELTLLVSTVLVYNCNNQASISVLFDLFESVEMPLFLELLQLFQLLLQFQVAYAHRLLASDHVVVEVVLVHDTLHDLLHHRHKTTLHSIGVVKECQCYFGS